MTQKYKLKIEETIKNNIYNCIIGPQGKWTGNPVTNHNLNKYAKLEKNYSQRV